MHSANGYFLRSVKDLLRWDVLRMALMLGLPLLAIWVAIGWVLWNPMIDMTTKLITWVPFSLVKANGALFITFFIWFVAVLVSFAIVTALIGPPILRKFKERTYYIYTFSTILLFSILWALVILFNWPVIDNEIQVFLTLLPFQTVSDALAWLLAFYLFYNAFILTLFLIVSYFRKSFLDGIKELDYQGVEIADTGISKSHRYAHLRDAVLFVIFSIAAFPVLFIPIANIVVQLILWAWLYREAYFLGVCNLYCTEEEYRHLREHNFTIWSIAILASLLNFIPVINIFTPFFAIIMFFHWIMTHKSTNQSLEKAEK